MRRDFSLENGIYCYGMANNFKLYYNNIELTPSCHTITYIPSTLIVVKSKNIIHIYRPKVIVVGATPKLIKLASIELYTCATSITININDKIYLIDSNLKVRLCTCTEIN